MYRKVLLSAALILSVLCLPGISQALPIEYTAELIPLNDSGVGGEVFLRLDDNILRVEVYAFGLEPGWTHIMNIQGVVNTAGETSPSVLPTLGDDTDGDGYLEFDEVAAVTGTTLLNLTNPPGGDPGDYPRAGSDGVLNFLEIYELTAQELALLTPLDQRVLKIHGLFVPDEGLGLGTPGEVNGLPGYKADLPVAIADLPVGIEIPEPMTMALLGLGSLTLLRRRRTA